MLAYNFEMMNCTCWVKYAKWRIRCVILSLIDVDKWWAYVDDLIRDWICLLCYVSILGGISIYMCYAWNPWMLMFGYVDYDWCEANPQWSVVDRLPICMNG